LPLATFWPRLRRSNNLAAPAVLNHLAAPAALNNLAAPSALNTK
jgi:hypothetical protein